MINKPLLYSTVWKTRKVILTRLSKFNILQGMPKKSSTEENHTQYSVYYRHDIIKYSRQFLLQLQVHE